MTLQPDLTLRDVAIWTGFLDAAAQQAMLADLRQVVSRAPFRRSSSHPPGRPMSVQMSAAGAFGWILDRRGYRYEAQQRDGRPWPPIPDRILAVWRGSVAQRL